RTTSRKKIMAAYEDFEFFRTSSAGARVAPAPPLPLPYGDRVDRRDDRDGDRYHGERHDRNRPDRDVLHDELERLHLEVTRLRARVRRRGFGNQLRRLVARL